MSIKKNDLLTIILASLMFVSCTAGIVIGHNQRQHQENNISTRLDSTRVCPTITIN